MSESVKNEQCYFPKAYLNALGIQKNKKDLYVYSYAVSLHGFLGHCDTQSQCVKVIVKCL